MATDARTMELLLERMGAAGDVTARKMFGEYGLYGDGKFFAVVCDDVLYLKPIDPIRAYAPDLELAPPYPGSKPNVAVPPDMWDDAEWFVPLVKLAIANAPPPKPKKAPKKKAAKKT